MMEDREVLDMCQANEPTSDTPVSPSALQTGNSADALITRLRQSTREHELHTAAYEAAVLIEDLLSENTRLREALKPFADAWQKADETENPISHFIRNEHFKRAKAALNGETE